MAIAERPAEAGLVLPPGSLPVDATRTALRRYRAGVGTREQMVRAIDLHADALEQAIASKAVDHIADFQRTVHRLEVLAGYVELRAAQLEWLKRFPADGPAAEPAPLLCPVGGGRQVAASRLLAALRGVELDQRVLTLATARPRRDGRRGAAPSLAALGDAGVSVTDVALALNVDRRKAWAILNGHQLAPGALGAALERLVGVDRAAVVLDGIPTHPRARAPRSRAVDALHDAGATAEDVAALIPVQPASVRRWLRGGRPPAKLGAALEQLLGAEAAAQVLALIPKSA